MRWRRIAVICNILHDYLEWVLDNAELQSQSLLCVQFILNHKNHDTNLDSFSGWWSCKGRHKIPRKKKVLIPQRASVSKSVTEMWLFYSVTTKTIMMGEGDSDHRHQNKIKFVRAAVHNSSWRPPGAPWSCCILLLLSTVSAQATTGKSRQKQILLKSKNTIDPLDLYLQYSQFQ